MKSSVPENTDSDSDTEYELLDNSALVPATAVDQPLTYTQMMAYSFSGFAKSAVVYTAGKFGGCLAVATIAPASYLVSNYFATPATSALLVKSANTAVVSASFDLGNYAGRRVAETTWDVSSSIISRTLTYAYNGGVSDFKDANHLKNAEKNNKKRLVING